MKYLELILSDQNTKLMKNTLLSLLFVFITAVSFSTTVTVTNSGTTFSPSTITIKEGDTVKFQISTSHNAIEVSQATWNANDNTALPGFAVDFGGGLLTGLTAGTHYYVCAPHASLGMKGKIIVNASTGLESIIPAADQISVYPNPTTGKFVVTCQGSSDQKNKTTLEVYNTSGNIVNSVPVVSESTAVDLSLLPAGSYLINICDDKKISSKIIVKQ
jgi:plastocyanin